MIQNVLELQNKQQQKIKEKERNLLFSFYIFDHAEIV
jgi:hypothetical protein